MIWFEIKKFEILENFEFNFLPALLVVRVASAEASPAAAKEFKKIQLLKKIVFL
jgi:hypothetical protein